MSKSDQYTVACAVAGLFAMAATQGPFDVCVKWALWTCVVWCLLQVVLIQIYSKAPSKSNWFFSGEAKNHVVRYVHEFELSVGGNWKGDSGLDIDKEVEIAFRSIQETEVPQSIPKATSPCVEIEIKNGPGNLLASPKIESDRYGRYKLFESNNSTFLKSYLAGFYSDHMRFMHVTVIVTHIDPQGQKAKFVVETLATSNTKATTPTNF